MVIEQICAPTVINSGGKLILSKDYDDYDIIILVANISGSKIFVENSFYLARTIEINKQIGNTDDSSYTWFIVNSRREFAYNIGSTGRTFSVYGIKLEGE